MPSLSVSVSNPGFDRGAAVQAQLHLDLPPPAMNDDDLPSVVGMLASAVVPGSKQGNCIMGATSGTYHVNQAEGHAWQAVAILTELLRLHHKTAGLTATPSHARARLRQVQPIGPGP